MNNVPPFSNRLEFKVTSRGVLTIVKPVQYSVLSTDQFLIKLLIINYNLEYLIKNLNTENLSTGIAGVNLNKLS